MATNPDFRLCKEVWNNQSFSKVLQGLFRKHESQSYNFARNVSQNELSGKMKKTAVWGSSWDIGISRNPKFYFVEKAGWDKFVMETFLGDDEFLTFTHEGKIRFNVNIFKANGLEMIQPP